MRRSPQHTSEWKRLSDSVKDTAEPIATRCNENLSFDDKYCLTLNLRTKARQNAIYAACTYVCAFESLGHEKAAMVRVLLPLLPLLAAAESLDTVSLHML